MTAAFVGHSNSGVFVGLVRAAAASGDRERFLQAGFDSYVAKPIIDELELLQTIARLLAVAEVTR